MPIVGLADCHELGAAGNGGSDCCGPGGIYHEKQVGALCGLHSLNNLLQGPHFTAQDLKEVAQDLDRRERELTNGQGLDYGNACADGFYNVQVMQVVLARAGCEMVPLKELPEEKRWQRFGPDLAREKAFILNKHKHWFALRRIGKEWFDLNSCLSAPHHYTKSDLRSHIAEAMNEGYAVFVVRGIFPPCELERDRKKLREAVKGCQEEGFEEDVPQHSVVLLIVAHFFGALQFDSFAPPARRVGENFTRRSFADARRRKLEMQGRAATSAVLPSSKAAASASTAEEVPDKLLRQHWPLFTLAQSLLAFALCLSFSLLPAPEGDSAQKEELGLESLLPGSTALTVHRGCEDLRTQVWRWLSYQFSHGSVSDAGMSAVLTVLLGVPLEGFWGFAWTALFFNLGVLGGAACHMVINTHVRSLVGMSAGTYSLLGIHMADLLLNWRCRRFARLKLLFLLSLASLDQTHALTARATTLDRWLVGVTAQGGGCLTGVLIGAVAGPNLLGHRREQAVLAASLLAGLVLLGFSGAWIAQWPPRSLFHSTPWCWARQVYNTSLFNGDAAWHCVRCQDHACIERWSYQQSLKRVDFNACNRRYGWSVTER